MGDGTVSLAGVLIFGLAIFVLPFAIAVYLLAAKERGLLIPVAVLSTSAAAFLATRRPGNLVAVWFPIVLVVTLNLLFVAGYVARRLAVGRRS